MYAYYKNNVPKRYNSIENYCKGRSMVMDSSGNWIKVLSSNYSNLTLSSKRGGHILLGEYFIAKYMTMKPIFMLLPRLNPKEIKKLNASNKKEWRILFDDSKGRVLTLDDLEGLDDKLKHDIIKLRNSSLKNDSPDKQIWDKLVTKLLEYIQQGKIRIKPKHK
jgi:hypothetical protein